MMVIVIVDLCLALHKSRIIISAVMIRIFQVRFDFPLKNAISNRFFGGRQIEVHL